MPPFETGRDETLSGNIDRLIGLVCGGPDQPPRPRQVLIGELKPEGGVPELRRGELRTPEEYELRFAELMGMNFVWMNMNYSGRLGDHGLVLIRYPHQGEGKKIETVVNFSGPNNMVRWAGWDATAYVTVLP